MQRRLPGGNEHGRIVTSLVPYLVAYLHGLQNGPSLPCVVWRTILKQAVYLSRGVWNVLSLIPAPSMR